MAEGSYRETLRERGLVPFLLTQFLGAFNDNVSKIIVSFAAQSTYGDITGPAVVAGVFIFPFLIFSGYAGFLADRYSKRTILRSVKVLEIGIMSVGLIGLLTGHLNTLLAVMFLMGVHSTFFGPSKYGIVPEIVRPEHMSTANGLLEMSTFAAIVLGTSVGGALYLYFEHSPWVMSLALIAIAVT
jgi:acyl-[acyl-carrier-protein]-phospholipid O-acyltransferase/long-chain-fatty-acid--[acyl-carrier-protein] ligase